MNTNSQTSRQTSKVYIERAKGLGEKLAWENKKLAKGGKKLAKGGKKLARRG